MALEADPKSKAGARGLLSAILSYSAPELPKTLIVVALAAVLEGAGIVLLMPVAEVIFAQDNNAHSGFTADLLVTLQRFGIETTLQQLGLMGAVFVAMVALRAWILLKRDVMLMRLSQGFVDDVRKRFFARLAHASWPVIKRYRKSQLLNTMTTNIGRLAVTMQFLSKGIILLAMAFAYLLAAFVVSTVLGLLLLGLTSIGLVSAIIWTRRSHSLGSRLNRANRGVMHETTLFLDGMKAAKATRAEAELTNRFAASIAETRAIAVEFVTQQARLRNAIQFIASIAALMVLVVGFGALGLSGGELLVMAAIVLRLAPNLVATFSGLQSIAHALPAYEAIQALDDELLAAQDVVSEEGGTPVPTLPPADAPLIIEDAAVDVVNEDGQTVRLVHIDELTVPAGSLLHIGGPSGAGKSSLAELIAGLHLPAAGIVARGDVELSKDTRRGWQSVISFAPQEPFIFDGSVRENLCWPNAESSEDAIWEVLQLVEAAELVQGLPGGLDESLLDGGARLSGGERQRLCLARALLRPASIVVLDEATSAMDPELERRIIGKLRADIGNRIVIMVSHSLNAVGFADMRINVANGVAKSG